MPPTPPSFLFSDHVSSRTRHILLRRMEEEQGERHSLSAKSFQLLALVCEDILPQESLPEEERLNLAVMIDKNLAGPGDGWRFAALPEDLTAWEAGLTSLDVYAHALFAAAYAALPAIQRGLVLDAAFEGRLPSCPESPLSPAQMALWSGDLRAAIVTSFLAHPLTQERLGISAVMTGGDKDIQGFRAEKLLGKEDFEP